MKSKDQILTKEQFESLWSKTEDSLDKLILVCGGILGMRVSEIANLSSGWIDFQQQKMRIPTEYAKSDKSARTIPFRYPTRAREILEGFFALQEEVGMTRQGISYRVKRLARKAKLKKKLTPHGLRATAAYRFAEAGLSAQALRQIMGW